MPATTTRATRTTADHGAEPGGNASVETGQKTPGLLCRGHGRSQLRPVSDLHLNLAGFDFVEQLVDEFDVDAVLDTGDITDWGSRPENELIDVVGALDVPYVYIGGNHDSAMTANLIAAQPNATVLDDSSVTVAGITVAGTPDPRFTPDQDADEDRPSLEQTGADLAEYVETLPERPDIALVHDPEQAPPLDGVVPLVLAGHTHDREVDVLDGGTRLMVQGSTGGAGLRALQGEYPEPLAATVLYLNPGTGELVAYDDITLAGLGETQVTIERTVAQPLVQGAEDEEKDTDGGAEPRPRPDLGPRSGAPVAPTGSAPPR